MADRFPSPFEMPTPPGAEGWQDLYAYSSVFSEDRREYEESTFWFMDGVHTPEVLPPWDATILEYAIIALSQYNTRHYVIPPALGVDIRFLNGYMYLSPVGVADPEEIGARVPEFAERAGYYFANWDRLYAAWMPKVRTLIDELESISFTPLPHREDMAVITEGRGTGSALDLLSTYHKLVDLTLKLWQYHFEFLNLGYAAYLDFFGCCKQLFPSIPDQAIAKMVAGIEVDLFRPDDEVKKLAQLAVELGIAGRFAGDAPAEEVLAGLRGDPQGDKWLAAWEEAKQPWFNFSAGTAFYHSDKVWLEYPDIPLGFLRAYIAKVQRGETLERPMEAVIAERDRIVDEYTDLIDGDEDRATFQAKLAVELGIADRFAGDAPAEQVLAGLRGDPQGDKWLAAWEEAKQPWFNFSAGTTFYHSDKVWLEYPDIPLGFLRAYIAKVQRGETLERPMEAVIAERDRIVDEYTDLIDGDEDRATFQAKLGLARTVFPYVENHNFYIEHWAHSVIWRKMRDLGRVLVAADFFADVDDVFLLSRHEVSEVLFDYYHGWAVGAPSRGPQYWPREMERRNGIMNALRQWSPPPALGVPPEVITEPFTVMLWGITSDSVRQWLGGSDAAGGLAGFAASPGVAEGPARVILSADGIAELREGEILVAPLTAPSWAPVFGKIAATVTDVGGIMSHAAIVCREYGLPAVTGTAFGTKNIKTGQRVRVDGTAGTVTIID